MIMIMIIMMTLDIRVFFFLFWSQWFFAYFRNCPINTGLGRRTSCRDKRWSHQIWGTWCSKITHSSGPPHIRFLVPIKAFLASLEISVVYISSTCTSWFLSKTDTFLTGAMCPSYRDVRLIESTKMSKEWKGQTLAIRLTEVFFD